jgi:hypothetical protein
VYAAAVDPRFFSLPTTKKGHVQTVEASFSARESTALF